MKLIICASWVGCPKNHGDNHLAELEVLRGTAEQLRAAMNQPVALWKKRIFTCQFCGQLAEVLPNGNYIVE